MGCDLQFAKCSVVCNLEAVGSADTSLWLVSASPTFFLTGFCVLIIHCRGILSSPPPGLSVIPSAHSAPSLCTQQSACRFHLPDLVPHSLAWDAEPMFSFPEAVSVPKTHPFPWLETGKWDNATTEDTAKLRPGLWQSRILLKSILCFPSCF